MASGISKAWLILYNIAMTAGWLFIGIEMFQHCKSNDGNYHGMYSKLEKHILIFQTGALMEVIHALTGIVRSNPMLTLLQVSSRIFLVLAVLYPIPQVHDAFGVPFLLTAWTVTEIVRYLYYTLALLQAVPYVLTWLRYTLFIVLYPMGVFGELNTIYNSLPVVKENRIFSISMPNPWNIIFNYYYFLIGTFAVYIIYFPQLYFHMMAQRRKVLNPSKPKAQ